jgi:hypothetical protein
MFTHRGWANRTFSASKYFEPGGRSATMPAAFSMGRAIAGELIQLRAQLYDKVIRHFSVSPF